MMSDHLPQELLSAWLDGELTPVEQAELERRLEESLELREQLAALTEVSQQIRMLPRPYAPPELRRHVLDQIQSRRLPAPTVRSAGNRLRRLAGWLMAGSAASLLLLAGWTLNRSGGVKQDLAVQHQIPSVPSLASQPAGLARSEPRTEPLGIETPLSPQPLSGFAMKDDSRGETAVEPVQVVSVSREEIRRRIDELKTKPQRGNSIKVPGSLKEQGGETPIVVVFTVVDVIEAMHQIQVLVQQQQIRSADNRTLSFPPQKAPGSALTAVTVELEMDGPEMAAVLNSVAAFDAIMYVEKEPAPPAERHSGAPPTGVSSLLRPEVTISPSVANEEPMSRQRQFNFQQLTTPAEKAAQAGAVNGRTMVQEQAIPSPAQTESAQARAMKPESSPQKSDRTPVERDLASRQLSPSSTAVAKRGMPPSPGWEEARRFRAFVLLKKQPDQVQSSGPSSPP